MRSKIAAAAGVLGLWSVGVPYVGHELGLGVNVAPQVEVVDHVVPGVVTAVAAGVALGLLRRAADEASLYLAAVAAVALAGLWMTATHVPLIGQARNALVPWDAALWHALPGFAVLALGAALTGVALFGDARREPEREGG